MHSSLIEKDVGALFTRVWQAAQPTPPTTNTVIESITEFVQSLGILGFLVALLGIGFVLLIIVLILFVWKIAAPMLAAWNADRTAREAAVIAERQARTDAQTTSSTQLSISNERERETQALRTRQAESLERVAVIMTENEQRQEQRYTDLTTSINTHTDGQVKETKEAIMEELKSIRNSLSDDKPGLGFRIAHVETVLASILETVKWEAATPPAVPAPVDAHNGSSEPQPTTSGGGTS